MQRQRMHLTHFCQLELQLKQTDGVPVQSGRQLPACSSPSNSKVLLICTWETVWVRAASRMS